MIQRLLYKRLSEGIQKIKNDPSIIESLFGDLFELDVAEVNGIKTAFDLKTPKVIHGYARSESEFPLYSIILGNESEAESYLSDDAGMIDDMDDPDYLEDRLSSIWESTFQIMCYTEHPDLTVYYYELAKSIIITADFFSWGVLDFSVSGMDLMPDPRYIPENLFVRQLTFKAKYEFQRIEKDSKLKRAFKLDGIHVDKSGSPSDVGPVKTLVKIIGATDEDDGNG